MSSPEPPTEPQPVEPVEPAAAQTQALPPPQAPPPASTWPPGWVPAPPPKAPHRHSAWIAAMTPLTAGILGLVLVLAGFGIGVVVGWQHDDHSTQHVMFGPERRLAPDQRQFGQGPYFNGPGRRGQPGQPGQPGPQRQASPTPSPSASS